MKILAVVFLLAGAVRGEDAKAFLTNCCAFTPAEWDKLDKGEAIGRLVKTPDRELSILGAVKLRSSKEEFLAWFHNLENFKLSQMVTEIKQFHNPAVPQDLAALTLDDQELKDARNCDPGKCGLKLSAAEMHRLKEGVDWPSPEAPSKAASNARAMVLDYVNRYAQYGDSALGTLEDRAPNTKIADTFSALIRNFPYLKETFAPVFAELANFGGMKDRSPDEFLYWSREKYGFGLKPLFTISHVKIFKPRAGVVLIASKQIRTSHYVEGSLGITMLVDAPGGAYLVYVNRSRIDMLRDAGWFRRTLIDRSLPGVTRREMAAIRDRVH